jgi:aminomethyltransferase
MADFGGWEMPIEYSAGGGGVINEHTAIRENVGLFDVSHLGKVEARGASAFDLLNQVLTNDWEKYLMVKHSTQCSVIQIRVEL